MRSAVPVLALLMFCTCGIAQSDDSPVRVACTVSRGKITTMVKPVYPPEALEKKIAGRVLLDVDITKDGMPKHVRVRKGHPLLANAAVDAVRQWRWEPFRLNGKGVPVQTTVTVKLERRHR
jgi:TonB family protein